MKLNAAQQQAVEYLNGPLLILAGPGTGKTQLLSSKVAYILEHTDASPDNILCITFTENGATNMRRRLATLIGAAASHVNIHTYHAFGTDLLYRYQQYSPDFTRQLDEAIDEVTQFQIVKQLVMNLPPRDILKKDNIKNIIDTISEAKSADLTAADLAAIAVTNVDHSAAISAVSTPVLAATTGARLKLDVALDTVYQPLLTTLTEFISDQPIAAHIEPLANELVRSLKSTIDTALAADKPSIQPLTRWRNANYELGPDGNWRLKGTVAIRKLASIAHVMDQYQSYLADRGLYDFDDMIQLAINTLTDDRGFRLTLQEQYQYILLDEFQDTNPSQFQLIKLLTDYDQPNVMAVGDDDQAIFAFQGANASNLLDFQEHYHAHVITLTENYRSTQPILDFSRHLADQLSESFAKNHNVNKRLIAVKDTGAIANSRPASPDQLDIHNGEAIEKLSPRDFAICDDRCDKDGRCPRDDGDNSFRALENNFSTVSITSHNFPTSVAEYSWLANKISSLIASGVSPSDIAIIAPKHKYLAPLLPYLKQQGINISYEKNDNVFDDPAISQLFKLARFTYSLATANLPAHLALELLSFQFWELPPIAAITATHTAHTSKRSILETLAHSDDPKLRQIAEFIAELVQLSYETPLELMFDYFLGTAATPDGHTSPFINYYQSHQDETALYDLYSHLHTLRRAVVNHTHQSQPHLSDLIQFVDDYAAAEYPLTCTTPYQTATSSVGVMSAHKSKGLEFDYVFLISVDDRAWGNSKGNNNTLSLPRNLVSIRHTGATEDECIRLFFVAATRAKSHLILTSSATDYNDKPAAPLQYLAGYDLPTTKHANDTATATQHADALRTHWVGHYQRLDTDLRNLLLKHLENYRLTATDLTTFIDLQHAGPQTIYERRILRAPAEPASPQLILGDLIHAAFERITKEHISDDQALTYFQERLDERALTTADRDELLATGQHALSVSLCKFGDLLRAPIAMSEVDFRKRHLTAGGVRLTGKIDHIEVDKSAKSITIYDFKTGRHQAPSSRSGWTGNLSLYKYSLQLEFYKLLLQSTPEYANYHINEGHVLFVTPDHDDQVYDEIYQFTTQSAADFLQLAQAVFHQITSLEFLNDPALNPPTNPNATIHDIHDFVQLLISQINDSQINDAGH